MMQPYPFFGFPRYRRSYPYHIPYYNSHNSNTSSAENEQKPCSPSINSKKEQGIFSCHSNSQNNNSFNKQKIEKCIENNEYDKNDSEETEECFEIFGLKLHFDDLLIIALLFFLYQEDVKDTYLYISLILLLLS